MLATELLSKLPQRSQMALQDCSTSPLLLRLCLFASWRKWLVNKTMAAETGTTNPLMMQHWSMPRG